MITVVFHVDYRRQEIFKRRNAGNVIPRLRFARGIKAEKVVKTEFHVRSLNAREVLFELFIHVCTAFGRFDERKAHALLLKKRKIDVALPVRHVRRRESHSATR